MSSTVVSALPKFIALKSNLNQKYLRYVNEKVETHGFLQFSGDEALSPFSKLEVVPAAKTGLVHIRCCYNNKYWARSSKNHWWIVAGADEPEEDQSQWSCTLFEPEVVKGDNNTTTVRFRHVQLGHYAVLSKPEAVPPYHSCMLARQAIASRTLNEEDVYTILDLEAELILPRYVAFKGDNDCYLGVVYVYDYPYLQFSSTDRSAENVATEVSKTSNGSLALRNILNNFFWRNNQGWIWAAADKIYPDRPEMFFSAVKVDDNNVLALRSLGNDAFCRRLSTDILKDCFNAGVDTITKEARLVVEELVLSRTIDNVIFHFKDAKIYNLIADIEVDSKEAINSSYEAKTMDIQLSYKLVYTSSWDCSLPIFGSGNTKTTLKSDTPFLADGGVFEILDKLNGEYHWGETKTRETTVNKIVPVLVPARTTYRLRVLATQGSCDIPFSYSQQDTLPTSISGNSTENKEDGIYTSINHFNFKEISELEPF